MAVTRDVEVVRFVRAEEMHRDAAESLIRSLPQTASSRQANVVIYLTGYVAECSLKAWILSVTPRPKQASMVNEFRGRKAHDLHWLSDLIRRRNVKISERIVIAIRIVASVWSSDLRYDVKHRRHDDASHSLTAATLLFDTIKGA
jgi:hypothetical protein